MQRQYRLSRWEEDMNSLLSGIYAVIGDELRAFLRDGKVFSWMKVFEY